MNRTITFVSLGPGEPELITLKGLKTLQQADRIFCPATLTTSGKQTSRAAHILQALEIEEEKIHPFVLPMSKDRQKAIEAYDQLLSDAIRTLQEDKKVVIVAEGDAGFYTSIQYIYHQLEKQQIRVQRVPGIPACIEAVHTCIRQHPEAQFHYFENVGTEKEKYISDPEIIAQTDFPYFSLLIIQS